MSDGASAPVPREPQAGTPYVSPEHPTGPSRTDRSTPLPALLVDSDLPDDTDDNGLGRPQHHSGQMEHALDLPAGVSGPGAATASTRSSQGAQAGLSRPLARVSPIVRNHRRQNNALFEGRRR